MTSKPKVKEISKSLYEIPELNHSVKLQTKQGRTLLLCSCTNHSKFNNENPWCYHKQLVMEYIILKPIKERINNLITEFEPVKNFDFKGYRFLEELKEIKLLLTKK